jgi:CRP-like cAMP-binding protein
VNAPVVTATRPPFADIVARRLEALAPLDARSLALIRGLADRQAYPPGAELCGERSPALRPRFVVSGWAAKLRWLADGRRQILGFVLPGEAIGLYLRPHPLALVTTVAITPLHTLDATPVLRAAKAADAPPGLAEAVRLAAGMDEALLLDQVVRLGRQTAYERICHLLLEFHDRLGDVGLSQNGAFALPLTQEVLADATGLSVVHVNRVLQQLRRERMIDLHGGHAALLDIEQLRRVADYQRPSPSAWSGRDAIRGAAPL